ncbi:hypothetical protein [Thermithiobacillus plumbiphilus]|uniref:Lipoprotein n=1 Tax=Thermithiobacillus plumbiphilus TaxID=1729899 RepID=A0ABU9D7B2_9PROT
MHKMKMLFVGGILAVSTVLSGCAGVITNAIREDRMQINQDALAQAKGHPIVIDQVAVKLDPKYVNEPRAYAPEVYRTMMEDDARQAARNAGLAQGQGAAYHAQVDITRLYLKSGRVVEIDSRVNLMDPAGRQVASVPLINVSNGTNLTQTSNFRYMHRHVLPGNAAAIVTLLQSIQKTGGRAEQIPPEVGFLKSYYGLEYPMRDATTARYVNGVR